MNSALEGTLAVGALTLVLLSCGGRGQAGPLPAEDSPAQQKLLPRERRPLARPWRWGNYGSSSSAATTSTKGASGGTLKTIVIKETELKLSPSTVTLSKSGTYAFRVENKGSVEHSLEIGGKGVKSKGGEVGQVKYCPIIGHRLAGMKGEVVVK